MFTKITIATADNVIIVGNYFSQPNPQAPAVVLLHMMSATKESWNDFASKLQEHGFQVLAIDERGHGESTKQNGEILNYKEFSDAEQQAKIKDLDAAVKFFLDKGAAPSKIFLGGGSIGANLIIQYMADHAEIIAGFALSAGYDYCGIAAKPLMARLHAGQHVYFVAADDDPNVPDSAVASRELATIGSAQKKLMIFTTDGHAENLFAAHPDLIDELITWLASFVEISKK